MINKYLQLTLIVFITIFAILPSKGLSQISKPRWGEELKQPKGKDSFFKLINVDEQYYQVLESGPKSLKMFTYKTTSHSLKKEEEVNLEIGSKRFFSPEVVTTKTGVFGVFNSYDKYNNQQSIFASELVDYKFTKMKKVYDHTYKIKWKFWRSGIRQYTDKDTQGYRVSPDSNRVVFINSLSTEEDKETQQANIVVFDDKMNLLWQKNQDFTLSDRDLEFDEILVDNGGTVFILAKRFNSKEEREKQKRKDKLMPNFTYVVFKITQDDISQQDISLGGNVIPMDATINLLDGNAAAYYLTGLYTDDKENSKIRGTFFLTSDNTIVEQYPFTTGWLEDIADEKDQKKGNGLSELFKIQQSVVFSNGTTAMIVEKYYTTFDSRQGSKFTNTSYQSRDLFISLFNQKGELIKNTKLPKYFINMDYRHKSFFATLHNDELFIIYNEFLDRGERKALGKGGTTTIFTNYAKLNSKGDLKKKHFFTDEESGGGLNPQNVMKYQNNLIMGCASKRKKYSFGSAKIRE